MAIEVSYDVDRPTLVAAHHVAHSMLFLAQWVTAVLLTFMGIGLGSWALVVIGVAPFVFCELLLRWQLRAHVGPVTVTMDERECTVTRPLASTTVPWSSVQSMRQLGRFWFLRTTGGGGIAIPRAHLDEVQTAAFHDLIARVGVPG